MAERQHVEDLDSIGSETDDQNNDFLNELKFDMESTYQFHLQSVGKSNNSLSSPSLRKMSKPSVLSLQNNTIQIGEKLRKNGTEYLIQFPIAVHVWKLALEDKLYRRTPSHLYENNSDFDSGESRLGLQTAIFCLELIQSMKECERCEIRSTRLVLQKKLYDHCFSAA